MSDHTYECAISASLAQPFAMHRCAVRVSPHRTFLRGGGHAVFDHTASVILAVWCRRSCSLGLRRPWVECRRRVSCPEFCRVR